MKKLIAIPAIVILLLVAVGCSQASNPSRNTAQGGFTAPATSTAPGASPPAKFFDPNSGIYFLPWCTVCNYEYLSLERYQSTGKPICPGFRCSWYRRSCRYRQFRRPNVRSFGM